MDPLRTKNCVGREKIIFTGVAPQDMLLSVELAGITYPSQRYHIRHNPDSAYVFEYVLEGRGWIEFEQQHFTVHEGDFYLIQKSTACIYGAEGSHAYKKIWFNVEGRLVEHLLQAYGLTMPVTIVHKNAERLFRKFHQQLRSAPAAERPFRLAMILHELIALVSSGSEPSQSLTQPLQEQIREYVNSHLGEPLRLEDIAGRFYISRAYLTRIFRQAYQQSPYDYILKRKMQVACNMLQCTRMPIQEIAARLAFNDPHYFSNAFKKIVGESPREYRQKTSGAQPPKADREE